VGEEREGEAVALRLAGMDALPHPGAGPACPTAVSARDRVCGGARPPGDSVCVAAGRLAGPSWRRGPPSPSRARTDR
jgi:hypothetical protein